MKFNKEELAALKNDPFAKFVAGLLGTTVDDIIGDAEKEESRTNEEPTKNINEAPRNTPSDNIKDMNGKKYEEPENPEELVEEDESVDFKMTKDDLKDFVKKYTKLEETFRKLEHTYGIDLGVGNNSIYVQANTIIWDLIGCIFGNENREDIVDFCFGDSNFDSIDDLYEELV